MIIETCPKCGWIINHSILTSNPPVRVRECSNPNCNWRYENKDEVITQPFKEPKDKYDIVSELKKAVEIAHDDMEYLGHATKHILRKYDESIR